MSIQTIAYRAYAEATGGRDGRAISSDGVLDVALTTPKELGGAGGQGTNPEQLFAAGYSACFLGAMKFVAGRDKLKMPQDSSIEGVVGIGRTPRGHRDQRICSAWLPKPKGIFKGCSGFVC
ncbi:Ohr family peroxiredoxin [Stutzerimonas zhaodongensis]|uniref:Ohr family peroxiredoxin n=1 Tax=Stutzerimonas zhaodongensis TaxID=1176257 RepID=UPI0021083789|nr:Ohr family peroxiredoxin [Stutzerimonas zhaodongensis]MCQ2028935.1 Ohr family peroxiredoxin [Stutzerimonas zhaodongensis]